MKWLRYTLWAIAAGCTAIGFLLPAEPVLYWAIVGLVVSGSLGIMLQIRDLLSADRARRETTSEPGAGPHGSERLE